MGTMSARELARALERARREPEDEEVLLSLLGRLRRLGAPPPEVAPADLPVLLRAWRLQPAVRDLEAVVLPLLGLEPSTAPPEQLAEYWQARGRAEDGESGWYDTRSGLPLCCRRPVDDSQMVLVPGGDFVRGSDEPGDSETNPPHRVTLEPFYLDRAPVDRARFQRFRESPGGRGLYMHQLWESEVRAEPGAPAHRIRWQDARAYCHWVGGRLPTEAELEKAWRGDDGRRFPWGDNAPLRETAEEIADHVFRGLGSLPGGAGPLGTLLQGVLSAGVDRERVRGALDRILPGSSDRSPYGLLGATNLLHCWSADWSGDAPFQEQPAENPRGVDVDADFETMTRAGRRKVVRRGSPLMRGEGSAIPVYARGHLRPDFHNPEVGLRVALSVQRAGSEFPPVGSRRPRRLRRRPSGSADALPLRELAELLRRL